MSVVIAAAFLDQAVLISDSRLTLGDETTHDVLKKIYQLGPHLAVGFTSNDVGVSTRIIQELTRYSKAARTSSTSYLLSRLPRVANYHYQKLTSKQRPPMSFSYAGIITDRYDLMPNETAFNLFSKYKGSFSPPEKLARYLLASKDGFIPLPPPIPVIAVQLLPENKTYSFRNLGIDVRGSGSGIMSDIEPEVHKILLCNDSWTRVVMLQISIKDFCKKSGIKTVGGLNQVVSIDNNGVQPQSYSYRTANSDGSWSSGKRMEHRSGGWVQIDLDTGRELPVLDNPLFFSSEDENFSALQGAIS